MPVIIGTDSVRAAADGGLARRVLGADHRDVGDLAGEDPGIRFAQPDCSPLPETRVGQHGPSAEEHDDPVPQTVKPLDRLPFESDRKSEQNDYRHRAPGDPEYGQDRTQTLGGKVRPQLPDHVDQPHGVSTTRDPR